jgi:C1A family cysteine protease
VAAAPEPPRFFGWKPSVPDPRDLPADTSEIPILDEVDPRTQYMTGVYDQQQLNSCTANAVAAAIDADRIVSGLEPFHASRLAIYWLERWVEHRAPTSDDGAYGRDGLKTARRYGVLPEEDWPYTDDKSSEQFLTDPRQSPTWDARHWKLEHPYKTVRRAIIDFKRVLSNRQTIVFGFNVPNSLLSGEVARSGVLPDPDPDDLTGEGHVVLAVGYLTSEPQHCLVRNSWGPGWGQKGYFLMPWSWLLDGGLSGDHRTIYRPLGA